VLEPIAKGYAARPWGRPSIAAAGAARRGRHRYIAAVARFLSSEWLRELDAALRAEPGLGERFARSPIAIGQEVATGTGPHAEPVCYVVVLDGAGGRLESGAGATPADVTFVCDRATAVGLARGEVNAQRALTSGRLKIRGEVDRLATASSALAGLGDLLAPLRGNTRY
jgi:hypothetical protein